MNKIWHNWTKRHQRGGWDQHQSLTTTGRQRVHLMSLTIVCYKLTCAFEECFDDCTYRGGPSAAAHWIKALEWGMQELRMQVEEEIRRRASLEAWVSGTENSVQEILHWLAELQHDVVGIGKTLMAKTKGEAVQLGQHSEGKMVPLVFMSNSNKGEWRMNVGRKWRYPFSWGWCLWMGKLYWKVLDFLWEVPEQK